MTVREIVDKIIEKTGVEPLPEDKTCDHLMTRQLGYGSKRCGHYIYGNS